LEHRVHKNKFVTKRTKKKRRRLITWGCVVVVLTALAVWMFYDEIVVKHYEINSDKVSSGDSVRIVVIADLHSIYYGENQQNIISGIKEQEPDMIALVGDIVDDNRSEDGAVAFLEGIRGLCPTYYVLGNHEVWSGEWDRIKEMVASYGITVLTNQSEIVTINGVDLCIGGIDDPDILEYSMDENIRAMSSEEELLEGFLSLNHNTYNILLAHRPERFEMYQKYGFDLVLSGHAHGGQIRIPGIINGVMAPNQGLFPKYAGGEYNENNQTMIVSRGFGLDARLPRIFNPPEIVVVDIMSE
jgi:predicted MPP superfamily phosphohydrolase